MPRPGDIDTTYPDKLKEIGLTIEEMFRGAKIHHMIRCIECNNTFEATPLSKLQNYKKHHLTGCPLCCTRKKYKQARASNIKKLQDRGLEVLSDWDGTTGMGRNSEAIPITVKNTKCGHTFTSSSKNLLTRGIECSICAVDTRTKGVNAWSKANLEHWQKTADMWELYKSKVRSLTRKTYIKHKDTINPNNLPTGKAGADGAYQLDHIVPIRYCFENYIPAEICADKDNLQILPWDENLGSKDKLKEHVPSIFEGYIKTSTR